MVVCVGCGYEDEDHTAQFLFISSHRYFVPQRTILSYLRFFVFMEKRYATNSEAVRYIL